MANSPIRLGILIPTRAAIIESASRPPVDECWAMARHADQAGYDAVWVGDSIVARPRLEVMTTLAYLAAITERVRLGTAVLLPALRQPTVLAHQIANVDQVSQGRVVLGLGVGTRNESLAQEWAACGMEFKARTKWLEEHIEVWRMLWSGEPVSYQGSGFTLTQHTIGPLPWNQPGPPILITAGNGGLLLPEALDRFARLGDGIITTRVEPEECRTLRQQAEEALATRGRSLPDFPICAYVTVRLEDDPATAERVLNEFLVAYYGPRWRERGVTGLGPGDAVAGALKQFEGTGVTDLCIRFAGDGQLAQLERFTKEVLPHFTT